MMPCDDIRTRLPALQDGELTAEEEEAVRKHAVVCASCARALSDYLALRTAISTAPPETADLWGGVSDQIAAENDGGLALAEMRLLREELRSLRGEIADLRREIASRPHAPITRSTPLSLPDAPHRSDKRYQLV